MSTLSGEDSRGEATAAQVTPRPVGTEKENHMKLDGLDNLVAKGQRFLDEHEPVQTHSEYNRWVSSVGRWLNDKFPDSGLSADWASQGNSNLVMGGGYYDDPASWSMFRLTVQQRLRWLGNLPLRAQIKGLSAPAQIQNEAMQIGRKEIKLNTTSRAYVDPERINELKTISSESFDLSKLIRLCEELNICFAGECYLSMVMLTRAILDHVPPIFGSSSFQQVANNYSGAKSFKEAMQNLENSSRKISDYYLHSQIRKSESLPNVTQIDFSNNVDFLLSEVIRLLKK